MNEALEFIATHQAMAEQVPSKSCLVCMFLRFDYVNGEPIGVHCPFRKIRERYVIDWCEHSYELSQERARSCKYYDDARAE